MHRPARLRASVTGVPLLSSALAVTHLQHDGLLTQDRLSDEELLTACQWMGIGQNLEVRERVADSRKLLKSQRIRLTQALWESTHPDQMNELFRARRENSPRYHSLMNEQAEIRTKLAAAVG